MNAIQPQGWQVVITFENEDCPYLTWTANYTGCNFLHTGHGGTISDCSMETCPFRSPKPPKDSDVEVLEDWDNDD